MPCLSPRCAVGLFSILMLAGCIFDWDSTWLAAPDAADVGVVDTTVLDAPQDLGADKSEKSDHSLVDTAVKLDAPLSALVYVKSGQGDTATCNGTNEIAVGGGGQCGTTLSESRNSGPTYWNTWKTACASGVPKQTWAICLKTALFSEAPVPYLRTSTIKSYSIQTCGTFSHTLISGGCGCSAGAKLLKSGPGGNKDHWACDCSVDSLIAFAVCLNPTVAINEGFVVKPDTKIGKKLWVDCPPGKAPIGGGCEGLVTAMYPMNNRFHCDFEISKSHKLWVYCID